MCSTPRNQANWSDYIAHWLFPNPFQPLSPVLLGYVAWVVGIRSIARCPEDGVSARVASRPAARRLPDLGGVLLGQPAGLVQQVAPPLRRHAGRFEDVERAGNGR